MPPNELLLNSPPTETTGLKINILMFHPVSNRNLESVAESSLAFLDLAVDTEASTLIFPKTAVS